MKLVDKDGNEIKVGGVSPFERSKNLYDITKAANSASGVETASDAYKASDYIAIGDEKWLNHTPDFGFFAFYDENKNFVKRLSTNDNPVSIEGYAYVRAMQSQAAKNKLYSPMLNFGEELAPYDDAGVECVPDANMYRDRYDVLYRKKMLAFGDSIVRGFGNNGVGYPDIIADRHTMQYANNAVSGASIAYSEGRHNIVTQIETATADDNVDVVLFGGLSNDITTIQGGTTTLGEVGVSYDTADFDRTTFCGALQIALATIREKWKNATLLYVIPHRMPSRDMTLQNQVVAAAKEVLAKWSVPYVDMYDGGELNTYIEQMFNDYTWRPDNQVADGTHPNDACYKRFYVPKIETALRGVIATDNVIIGATSYK